MNDRNQNPGSITQQIDGLVSDNQSVRDEAARQIWQRYFGRLSKLVQNHLDGRIRQREDEDDVVQEMYHSFFRRQSDGDFDLANRDELWQLLVTIVLRKVRNKAKHHQSQKRDYRNEAHKERDAQSLMPNAILAEMAGVEPTPLEAAAVAEAVEQRLQVLSEPLRQIALWKLEGFTHEEIAGKMGYSKRTVIRKVELIGREWSELDESD